MRRKLLLYLSIGFLTCACLTGCEDEIIVEEFPVKGTGNSITAFTLTTPEGLEFEGFVSAGKIEVSVPLDISLENATVSYSLSELATILPEPESVSNWEQSLTFRVTSFDGQHSTDYTYTLTKTDVESQGNVVLTTQAEVEAFAKLHNSIIAGNLILGGEDLGEEHPITDLSALTEIKEVKGEVVIRPTLAATSLKGLDNLKSAMAFTLNDSHQDMTAPLLIELPALETLGALTIQSNQVTAIRFPRLKSFGAGVLQTTAKEFSAPELTHIFNNMDITRCEFEVIDLPKLQEVNGLLKIWQNKTHTSLTMPELKRIGGNLQIVMSESTDSISMPKLERVGEIEISRCRKITTLEFPALVEAGGMDIGECNMLERVAFPQLERVAKTHLVNGAEQLSMLNVWGYETLQSVEFPVLKSAPSVRIAAERGSEISLKEVVFPELEESAEFMLANASVTTFSLPKLVRMDGRYSLQFVKGVESVDLSHIEGIKELYFTSCEGLKEVKSPRTVEKFTQDFSQSPEAISFTGLEEVTERFDLILGGSVQEVSFPAIRKIGDLAMRETGSPFFTYEVKFADLEQVTSVAGNLPKMRGISTPRLQSIEEGLSLTSLAMMDSKKWDFSSLTTVGKDLYINGGNGTKITDMNTFSSLTEVGGMLKIWNCKGLDDFTGLQHVIPSLEDKAWDIRNCKYTPTLEDMRQGRYTK